MLSNSKISKGGLIGALVALFASLFTHKQTDSSRKRIVKSGTLGLLGYLIGHFIEKKIRK
jgi:hypothetical protein